MLVLLLLEAIKEEEEEEDDGRPQVRREHRDSYNYSIY